MKAILVIDMPKCCDECPVMDFDQYKCSIVDDVVDEKWDVGRQSWCPLKLLPDRQKVKAGAGGYTRGFTAGFNKFRYLIAGEETEK